MRAQGKRLFVLGAGASYAVGLPDAARVLPQLTMYSSGPYAEVENRLPMQLLGDVTSYLIRFAKEAGVTKGDRFPLDAVAQRFYQTWGGDPRFYPVVAGFWQAICEFLYERSLERAYEYADFVEALEPGDLVLSFNWDSCLEIALHRAKKPFTLSLEPKPRSNKIRILKAHGSVDFTIADGPKPDIPRKRFYEIVHPAMPPVQTPQGVKQPKLYRTLTYDLPFRVVLHWTGPRMDLAIASLAPESENARPDVGALHLRGFMLEGMPYLLTPGSPQLWYDWSYARVKEVVDGARDIGEVYVIGYSFPEYDTAVAPLLTEIIRSIGPVPVHIVNPGQLPRETLNGIFPSYELHACGFLEYPWRREKGKKKVASSRA